jgi:hypothetical protein
MPNRANPMRLADTPRLSPAQRHLLDGLRARPADLEEVEAERLDLSQYALQRRLVGEHTGQGGVAAPASGPGGQGTRSGSSCSGDRGHRPGNAAAADRGGWRSHTYRAGGGAATAAHQLAAAPAMTSSRCELRPRHDDRPSTDAYEPGRERAAVADPCGAARAPRTACRIRRTSRRDQGLTSARQSRRGEAAVPGGN